MRPYIDKVIPKAWKAAQRFSTEVREAALEHGLSAQEFELINVRASQLNGCAFCLDMHSRQARDSELPQQKLDLLPAWREPTGTGTGTGSGTSDTSHPAGVFSEREAALLAIAEAATQLPLTEDARADLSGALVVLGEETFAAAEWVAVSINAFNRVSILSEHPVRPRDGAGKLMR
ncbi:carboxymuconolactone decarboxylase family protein [Leucobacter sp. HY1910]